MKPITGRMTAPAPNLQNIQIRTDEGQRIRRLLLPQLLLLGFGDDRAYGVKEPKGG
jgi:hypothetical protein